MTAWLQTLWAPSLVRRVVLALLVAFALVWAVLAGMDFIEYRRTLQSRDAMRRAVQAMAAALDFDDEARAATVMQGTETQYNLLRQAPGPLPLGDLLLQLARTDGTLVYRSAALPAQGLTTAQTEAPSWALHGQAYHLFTLPTPHWRITLLEPALGDAQALRVIGGNLLRSMLIAFPLVLLPLWLAVRRGLQPLRVLVQRVAQRDAADFSPLQQDLRYAELRPLEQALDALLAHARQGIQSERGFVQDAAHELRTPLAAMAVQAHALAGAADPATQQQARQALEHAIARASNLVHQLLTLARLESAPAAQPQAVDLVELLQDLLARAQRDAQRRGIDLGLESPETLPAQVDVPVLLSALENLVGNALAYVQEGARVTVRLHTEGRHITLQVADDGPGIPPDERARLLQRFQRGRDVQVPGTGLGLAIAAQAMAQLHGQLVIGPGLEPTWGVGFSLIWPVA